MKMKMARSVAALILAGVLCGPAFAVDKAALIEHVRESYSFPPGIDVTLGDPKPSEVPGFDVMEMTISRGGEHEQKDKLYIAKGGRYYMIGEFKDLQFSPDQDRVKKMNLAGAPVRGNKKAKVQVVEYTDFECPFCLIGYQVMRDDIMKEYGSRIEWVYKSFPLREIHPWAESAAIGAECAHQQSEAKFWALHDVLFDNQKLITPRNIDGVLEGFSKGQALETVLPGIKSMLNDPDPQKKAIAKKSEQDYGKERDVLAQIDPSKFKACYLGKDSAATVEKDLGEGASLGVNGTPAFVINGRLIPGADGDSIKDIIEESLKKSEKS